MDSNVWGSPSFKGQLVHACKCCEADEFFVYFKAVLHSVDACY